MSQSGYKFRIRAHRCLKCGHSTLAEMCRLCGEPTVEVGTVEYNQTFGEDITMEAKAIVALQKRYEFWHVKQNSALETENNEGFETATTNIAKCEEEAKEAGVTLAAPGAAKAALPEVASTTAGTGKTKSKSVKGAEAVAAKTAAVAADKAAGTTPGATKVKKEKKAPTLRPCLEGCGAMVAGNFQMGHDAKLKSLILKIERGEEGQETIPDIVQDLIKFKKAELEKVMDKEGKLKETIQHYTCTAAPVKLTGRAEGEFKLTKRTD